MYILESIRIIAGLILILFIPGYALTWVLYPRKQDIPLNERVAVSFALSIASVIILVLFIDTVLGIDTTPINIVMAILLFTILSAAAWKIHLYIITSELRYRAKKELHIIIKKCRDRINKIHVRP